MMFAQFLQGRRRRRWVLILALLAAAVTLKAWWFSEIVGDALSVPPPPRHELGHLRQTRNLKHYLDNIELVTEPSANVCESPEEVPLLVVVASAPSHVHQRAAIRRTWASWQPTYFVLGVDAEDSLSDTFLEAKEYSDIVVYDFADHYQNLTLKSALMLHWAHSRCQHAGAVFKTDDDVLLNPWGMRDVLILHENSQLIGYRVTDSKPHRDEYTKWYMPRWLFPYDTILEYLSGTGYIIQGDYIESILKAAETTPMVNLEDVYFTYSVAKATLGMTLTHERRLSPYKPWLKTPCAFWGLASSHSLSPQEMIDAWEQIAPLGMRYNQGELVCLWSGFLSSDYFLF